MASPKQELRGQLRARRRALEPRDLEQRSAQMTTHLLGLEVFRDASTIAAFVGVRGEPDTKSLLTQAMAGGKVVYLPRVVSKTSLVFARVDHLVDLVSVSLGLLEPPPSAPVLGSPSGLDLVLVPGVAFETSGARLGQGGGYYDRFLPHSDAVRVGLCLSEFVVASGGIPMGEKDVRVDWLVTENGVRRCSME